MAESTEFLLVLEEALQEIRDFIRENDIPASKPQRHLNDSENSAQSATPLKTAHFSGLPLELKQDIFAYLSRPRDKKAARLVCRDWNRASYRFFYKAFYAHARNSIIYTLKRLIGSKKLPDLLGEDRAQTLSVLQNLIIEGRNSIFNVDMAEIKKLVALLPHGQLHMLHCIHPLSTELTRFILERQQNLRLLSIPQHRLQRNGDYKLRTIKDLISSCKQLQGLHLTIDPANSEEYTSVRSIIHALPKLRNLSLAFLFAPIPLDLLFRCPKNSAKLFDLEILQLSGLWDKNSVFTLDYVNLKTLVVLKLRNFHVGVRTIEHLTESFRSLGESGTSLKSFEVTLRLPLVHSYGDSRGKYLKLSLEILLKSFRGLHTLIISTANNGIICPSTIEHHAATLRNLCINSNSYKSEGYERNGCYSAETFHSILGLCQNLETLAIRLPRVDAHDRAMLGAIEIDSSLPHVIKSIATHKKLRGLRVLNSPYWEHSVFSDNIHPANLMLRDFGHYGSSLELLSAIPFVLEVNGRRFEDDLRDVFPALYYVPKSIIDNTGKVQTTAVPYPEAEQDFSDMEIMFEDFGMLNLVNTPGINLYTD